MWTQACKVMILDECAGSKDKSSEPGERTTRSCSSRCNAHGLASSEFQTLSQTEGTDKRDTVSIQKVALASGMSQCPNTSSSTNTFPLHGACHTIVLVTL